MLKKFFVNEEITNRYGKPTLRIGRIIATSILMIFLGTTCLSSYKIIPTGYTGVKTTFGQVSQEVVQTGFNWKIPFIQKIQKVNNKQQDINFEDKVWGETSERTAMYMADVTVTYQINPEYSAWIYSNVSDYKDNLVSQVLVNSALKAASKQLSSEDATNRAIIEPLAQICIQESLDNKYGENVVVAIKVFINDMDFENSYNEAIAQKQIAQQEYERQQILNQKAIETAEADPKQKLISAQAEADAELIKAKAQAEANSILNKSINQNLIDYEKIQKWDGALPAVTGGNAIIDLTE